MVTYYKSSLFRVMVLAELSFLISEVLLFHQKLDSVHELIILEEYIQEPIHSLELEDL
jgi:hypothetical protein